ncbi:Uncharacterised protein [Streptococcus salivarius]|nr:Uncharacterised protein [Streptococcus salivarius]VUW84713.1 Uncharacterised protein [Streptococcus thermophilus]
MKIKLGSIFLFCLLILTFINYNFISTYNLFTFYILLMLLPSILYSNCCVILLRRFNKGTTRYYLLSTIVHFLLNWMIIHRLLTKEVFNSLVENTMKINPNVGNNISLDLSISSFFVISLFVFLLMLIENYFIRKVEEKYVSK